MDDPTLEPLFQQAKDEDQRSGPYVIYKGLLYRTATDKLGEPRRLLVVPSSLRRQVFQEAHETPLAGHFANKKTKEKVARSLYWPGMAKDIHLWCKQCDSCQKHNMARTHKSPLVPLPAIEEPWRCLTFDIVGPMPRTARGHRYLLTCMDFASRYPEAIPLKRADAQTVADAMLQVFSRYGLPTELLTDNGGVFTGKLARELYTMLKIKHIKITEYNPQSNGTIERWHRSYSGLKEGQARELGQSSTNGPLCLPRYATCLHRPYSF